MLAPSMRQRYETQSGTTTTVPVTLIALPAAGADAIAGRLTVVIKVDASARVTVRTTCDGGKACLADKCAYMASSARFRYTCKGTIRVGKALLKESK